MKHKSNTSASTTLVSTSSEERQGRCASVMDSSFAAFIFIITVIVASTVSAFILVAN